MEKMLCVLLLITGLGSHAFGQEEKGSTTADNRYFEDQFYVGVAYNFIVNRPDNHIQRSLSYSLQAGIIKDIPLNKARNLGIGVGFGYGTNSYYSNMLALETDEGILYRLSNANESFKRSKLETHALEFPFEIRWRTSNAVDYKFWRIYAGFKMEYLFSRRSELVADDLSAFEGNTSFSNANIRQWQYGATLSFGYNTWNLHINWALNDLLDGNALFNNEPLGIRPLRVGLIFYIL